MGDIGPRGQTLAREDRHWPEIGQATRKTCSELEDRHRARQPESVMRLLSRVVLLVAIVFVCNAAELSVVEQASEVKDFSPTDPKASEVTDLGPDPKVAHQEK